MGLKGLVRTLAVGAAAGAAVVWLNDPERGAERRRQVKQKADDAAASMGIDLDGAVKTAKGRAEELADTAKEEVKKQTGAEGADTDGGEGTTSTSPGTTPDRPEPVTPAPSADLPGAADPSRMP